MLPTDSAIVVDLHGLAVSQNWLASLVVFLANYAILLLPLVLAVVWFRADMPGDHPAGACAAQVAALGCTPDR